MSQTAIDRDRLFATYLNFPDLIRGGSATPHWLKDGTRFWYAEGELDSRVVWLVNPAAGTEPAREPLFDVARLRAALTEHLRHEPPYAGVPFAEFAFDEDARRVSCSLEGRDLTLDLNTYAVSGLLYPPTDAERERDRVRLVRRPHMTGLPDVYEAKSPDGRWIVGEEQGNLTLRATVDGRHRPLTTDGNADAPWDVATVKWAPDSSRFVVTKRDYTNVPRLPIVHWLKKNEQVEWVPYSKTGEPLAQMRLFAVEVVSGRATPLDTGERRDEQLIPIAWSPDARELTVLVTGRAFRYVRLLRADAFTGKTQLLLHEEPSGHLPGSFTAVEENVTVLKDGRFLWTASHDGWPHLYLHDRDGSLVRQLTHGEFPVLRAVAVDETGGWVYFLAHGEERPYDTHLYRVNLAGECLSRLTEGTGQHGIIMSPSCACFVDTHSSIDRPPVTELRRADGTRVMVLSEADTSALDALPWRPPEEFTALAADGKTEVHGVLYLPPDFDPTRKYPLVEVIYGGAQVAVVPRTFAAERLGTVVGLTNFARALSAVGFVTMIVDTPGTPGRSQAFHNVSHGTFGQHVVPDHAAVVRQLGAARPYIDLERVGITGGSWGGYNTLRAMVMAPETYKVGIVCNGVGDLEDHMASAGEAVMGLPSDDPEGYGAASSFDKLGNLTGKVLLVGSTNDINGTYSATMKMVDAFTRANKPYDLMLLHEQNHHPKGATKTYWVNGMRRYFEEHLRP